MIKELLSSHGIKATNQRIDILSIIKEKKEVSIKELCNFLPNIDKSTVYRTIEMLENNNILTKGIRDKRVVYELKTEHKHYLNCIKCHKKIEIKKCPFHEEEIDGFKIVNHSLNIEGICNTCQKSI